MASETDLLGALAFQLNPRTLVVTQNITLQGINQVNQLVIKSSITIQGATPGPPVSIDGNGITALFNVTSGGSLVIKDLEIRNGYVSGAFTLLCLYLFTGTTDLPRHWVNWNQVHSWGRQARLILTSASGEKSGSEW